MGVAQASVRAVLHAVIRWNDAFAWKEAALMGTCVPAEWGRRCARCAHLLPDPHPPPCLPSSSLSLFHGFLRLVTA